MRQYCLLAIATAVFATGLFAQRRVDPHNSFHRVIGVLPLAGAGTQEDPVRPKYAPAPQASGAAGAGIIAFAFELSDDGKHAIAELVAVDRSALAAVLADREPGVLVFEKGTVAGAAIESAVRAYRKDFSLDRFGVAVR
jgi:hypothetical protein